MQSHRPGLEGTILAFALIFTVLLGAVYAVAMVFRFAVPWLAIVLLSIFLTAALRLWRR
jgi:hypothetical protein